MEHVFLIHISSLSLSLYRVSWKVFGNFVIFP